MLLYILRHGIAIERDDPECPAEPERYLTAKGIARTREAMAGLAASGAEVEAVISSPYTRAVQTAEIAAEALGFPAGSIERDPALKPMGDPDEILGKLADRSEEAILLVGHAPNLDLIIARVVEARRQAITSLGKAGVAVLEAGRGSLRGELVALYPPKVLRVLAR